MAQNRIAHLVFIARIELSVLCLYVQQAKGKGMKVSWTQ